MIEKIEDILELITIILFVLFASVWLLNHVFPSKNQYDEMTNKDTIAHIK